MLLKLSLLLSTIGIIACNVPFDTTKEVKYEETNQIHQRNYQHSEYLNSYTEVVYKYETNEVNSIDDLVVGNIYTFDLSNITTQGFILRCKQVIGSRYDDTLIINLNSDSDYLVLGINSSYETVIYYYYNNTYISSYLVDSTSMIFVYDELLNNNYLSYISSSDYNEIESVIYHQPQTIVGVINEFCETYLFSEIPYINTMTFEVGGQSINLMTYLIIIVGIVLAIGLLILFFWFLKFIFGLFAGVFRMRR